MKNDISPKIIEHTKISQNNQAKRFKIEISLLQVIVKISQNI
jgi:hypothetical protein